MEYKRKLKDLEKVKHNGYKVFSCFSCGGGSSMGYKNAGYEVIGTCEIDPQMDKVYQTNFPTKYRYLMGVQEFKNIPKSELPSDLFNIDLLDGSPPCSTFSVAGLREKVRGKEKVFREGQAKQILSDLFFDYLDIVEKLHPKVVVAENVKGLIQGKAKGYLKLIHERFTDLGYTVQIFLLNGATMGLPQKRERVFFIAHRKEYDLPKLRLEFNEEPILFKEIHDRSGKIDRPLRLKYTEVVKYAKYGDNSLQDADIRYEGKGNYFNTCFIYDDKVLPTITAHNKTIIRGENRDLNDIELYYGGSRPSDYNFLDVNKVYLIGMSVPPLMMFKVSDEVRKQRLDLIPKS